MKEILSILVRGIDLSPAQMERAVGRLMDGRATQAQIGAFLAADLLEALGARIDLTAEQALAVLESTGITFLFEREWMHPVAEVLRRLGCERLQAFVEAAREATA